MAWGFGGSGKGRVRAEFNQLSLFSTYTEAPADKHAGDLGVRPEY